MEELLELRKCIEEQRYPDALLIIGEMEEMSREDKRNNIYSYAAILLMYLIKKEAEQRTTRSWDFSIYNSVTQIAITNKRRKAGGVYVPPDEMRGIALAEAYPLALKRAAMEAFEGQFSETDERKAEPERVRERAFQLIQEALTC